MLVLITLNEPATEDGAPTISMIVDSDYPDDDPMGAFRVWQMITGLIGQAAKGAPQSGFALLWKAVLDIEQQARMKHAAEKRAAALGISLP